MPLGQAGRPRVCHTEYSKSEREKQTPSIKAYMWNLEKRYRQTYFQGRNRDAAVGNRHGETGGKERVA